MHQKTSAENLLTTLQFAEKLGVSPGTLAGWRSTGICQIPYIKIGRCVRYRAADIEKFIQDQTHLHTHLKKSGDVS